MPRKKIIKIGPRMLKYINQHGIEVVLPEESAAPLHFQMKKFLGDQWGDKTLPRGVVVPGAQYRNRTVTDIKGNEISRADWENMMRQKIGM